MGRCVSSSLFEPLKYSVTRPMLRERERVCISAHFLFRHSIFLTRFCLLGIYVSKTLVVSFISSRFRREKRVGCWLYTSLYFYTRLLPFWFSIVSFLFFADCSESFKNRKDDMGEANEETTEREREEISPTLKNGSVSRLFPPFAWCSLSQTGSAVSRQRNKDRLECTHIQLWIFVWSFYTFQWKFGFEGLDKGKWKIWCVTWTFFRCITNHHFGFNLF